MTDAEKLAEIYRLLDEAYDHYFKYTDGYCKSSEGHVSVSYGNYWDRKEGAGVTGVSIYSYLLGPSRNHDFENLDQALATVREWHTQELETVYDEHGEIVTHGPQATLYSQIERQRDAELEAMFAEFDRTFTFDSDSDA